MSCVEYTCDHCNGQFHQSADHESDVIMEYQETFSEEVRAQDGEMPIRLCETCYRWAMSLLNAGVDAEGEPI